MSLPPNTINTLQRITVKPALWILRQDIQDGDYRITTTFIGEPKAGDFFEVTTARGDTKVYKTLQAAINDVLKVMKSPLIQIHQETQ